MDMSYALTGPVPVEAHLLQGCCREAERAEVTALSLDGLRLTLLETFQAHMVAVIEEIRRCGALLRDLADRAQVHIARVQIVLDYLNIILPCLSKTLRDIMSYIEDKTISKETRWRKMYHEMSKEAAGLKLPERFGLYNHFLTSLKQLLTRSPNFDLNILETLRNRILQLRQQRGIPPPPLQVGPVLDRQALMFTTPAKERNVHWAEKIFSLPLPSRTALPHPRQSKSYGMHFPLGGITFPPDPKILIKRSFNNDEIALYVIENPINKSPYLLIRSYWKSNPWFSLRGAHELVINREGSALQLKRWSQSEKRSKPWAVLFFQTWEEMVLFHSTFVSLKAGSTLTVQIHPAEYKLAGEKRLFQAQITNDDGYRHSLVVYEDQLTNRMRLHAAVWEGQLRQCPVWTAFITHHPPQISRRSKHRVWLKGVQIYVFCKRYRQENMRQNKNGAFEICFFTVEAAARFKELFDSFTPESSEANVRVSSKGKEIARD